MRRVLLVVAGILIAGCGSPAASASPSASPAPSTSGGASASASASLAPSASASLAPSASSSTSPAANPTDTTTWRTVGEVSWHWRLRLPADAVAMTATDAKSAATIAALQKKHPNEQPWLGAVASQLGDGSAIVFRMAARVDGGLVGMNLYTGKFAELGSSVDAVARWARLQSATSETPWTIETVRLPAGEAVRVDQGPSGTAYYIPANGNLWSLSAAALDADPGTLETVVDAIAQTFETV